MTCRHEHLRSANRDLAEFNSYSSEQHTQLAGRFVTHAATLQTVHSDLLSIFKRVRALRGQLVQRHPELAAALEKHEAAREEALEVGRGSAPGPSTREEAVQAATSAVAVATAAMAAKAAMAEDSTAAPAGPGRVRFVLDILTANLGGVSCRIRALRDDG